MLLLLLLLLLLHQSVFQPMEEIGKKLITKFQKSFYHAFQLFLFECKRYYRKKLKYMKKTVFE
jgi:hypothetical protein